MGIGKILRGICVIFLAMVFAGCSSSSNGGSNAPASLGYETFTTSGSDLVLKILDTLELSQEEIEDIFFHADQVDHCYTTNREFIDIVLAEACVYYDMIYLFPRYFPQNLDNILNVNSYVEYLGLNDPFTFYISPEDYDSVMSFFDGDRSFVGFSLECNGQTVTEQTPLLINNIDPYTRAWIDGFQVGDKIIEIDGRTIEGMNMAAVGLLFPTNEEETVEITVDRNGIEITIPTAAEENIGVLLYDDIAYLNARSFTDTTGKNLRLDYNKLQAEAGGTVDKLILDLRDNGGGAVSGSLELVDYLIDNDNGTYPIISTCGPAYEEETKYLGNYNDDNIGDYGATNFVLLIDEHSASASELVAAALKHYGTAILIGETTYGKGIGQGIVELIDGSGIVVPAFYSLPPSGESYHGIGISPDYYLSAQAFSFDDDPVLDAAVEYLNTGIIPMTASSQLLIEKSIRLPENTIDPLKEQLLKTDRSGYSF